MEKWKSLSTGIDPREGNHPTGGFDCNICLELVQEPVVTLCGHLYCWPCIYKWIHCQSISNENPDPQCPVCKSEVSQDMLVPLYGRGQSTKESPQSPHLGLVVPRRPPSPTCGSHTATGPRPALQLRERRNMQPVPPVLTLGGASGGTMTTTGDTVHPTVGIYGQMVYSRIFENSETTMYSGSPNSYRLAVNSSPRLRRHMVEADKSLGRICFFFCCCIVLCLLSF
jgi:E3 ubiquitin-protein ligase RNF5